MACEVRRPGTAWPTLTLHHHSYRGTCLTYLRQNKAAANTVFLKNTQALAITPTNICAHVHTHTALIGLAGRAAENEMKNKDRLQQLAAPQNNYSG